MVEAEPGRDRLSTAAFAVGLAAALTGVVYFVAVPLGLVGLGLGLFALHRLEPGNRRVAVGGTLLSVVGLAVGLGVIAFLIASDDDDLNGNPIVVDGIESGTHDAEHPPQRDVGTPIDCQIEVDVLRAAGEVTNPTPVPATYRLITAWENDGRRIGEATAVVEDVPAGETRGWEVTAVGEGNTATTCRVLRIDRTTD